MKDGKSSYEIGKMLKKRYILALSIIAFLVVLSQGIIQLAILSQQDDSRVINIAGRQRMLSQRINKTAFGLYISENPKDQERYLKELGITLELWERSHKGLQNGDPELGLPGKNSPLIVEMFKAIEPQYGVMVTAAASVHDIAAVPGYDKEDLLPGIRQIQANEQDFLKGMDAIVFQYDSESKHKVELIKYTEILILVFTLFTLTMEVIFIFRPAQKQIEEAVAEIETGRGNLEKLFETAPAAMFLIESKDYGVIKLNRMAADILKVPYGASFKLNIKDVLELRQVDAASLLEKVVEGASTENVELVLHIPGNLNPVVQLSSNHIQYNGRDAILMGLADITRLKEAEDVLKRFATVDEMTGLLNKRSGLLVLENAFERVHRGYGNYGGLSVCFMDIDGLKNVNDDYGHDEGDFYIRTISRVIRNNVSSRDTVFRYGGDEIVLIMGDCDRQGAETALARIQGSLKLAAQESGKPYIMHISHGVAVYGEGVFETPEAMLTQADKRMYQNKRRYKRSLEG